MSYDNYWALPLVVRWRLTLRHPECKLSRTARLVLHTLALFMDSHGTCYPSVPKIAQAANMGESTVYPHLKELVATGYLAKKRRPYRSTLYAARIPDEVNGDPSLYIRF